MGFASEPVQIAIIIWNQATGVVYSCVVSGDPGAGTRRTSNRAVGLRLRCLSIVYTLRPSVINFQEDYNNLQDYFGACSAWCCGSRFDEPAPIMATKEAFSIYVDAFLP